MSTCWSSPVRLSTQAFACADNAGTGTSSSPASRKVNCAASRLRATVPRSRVRGLDLGDDGGEFIVRELQPPLFLRGKHHPQARYPRRLGMSRRDQFPATRRPAHPAKQPQGKYRQQVASVSRGPGRRPDSGGRRFGRAQSRRPSPVAAAQVNAHDHRHAGKRNP